MEVAILRAAVGLRANGVEEFHGFMIAREMVDRRDSRRLTGHGTLYKALDRLSEMGFVVDRWEDPMIAAEEGGQGGASIPRHGGGPAGARGRRRASRAGAA